MSLPRTPVASSRREDDHRHPCRRRTARAGADRALLEDRRDVKLVAECADRAQALEIQQRRPDLLFLDVQMPRLNGSRFLGPWSRAGCRSSCLRRPMTNTRSGRLGSMPSTYLLRPFTGRDSGRRCSGCERAWSQDPSLWIRRLNTLLGQIHAPVAGGRRILVRSSGGSCFLKPEGIVRVERREITSCCTQGEQHILREQHQRWRHSSPGGRHARQPFGDREPVLHPVRFRRWVPGRYSLLLKNGVRLDDLRSGDLTGAPGRNLVRGFNPPFAVDPGESVGRFRVVVPGNPPILREPMKQLTNRRRLGFAVGCCSSRAG